MWYLGEDTREYEDGKVTSHAGAWEAGVDGALPGIVMPAAPSIGEAEDMMEILAATGDVSVPFGDYSDVVTTRDWTPLEPDVVEQKSYAPGVGKISEVKVAGGDEVAVLVEHTPGS